MGLGWDGDGMGEEIGSRGLLDHRLDGCTIRFKSPDYSSQKGKRFTEQNKKVLNSLNRKIF